MCHLHYWWWSNTLPLLKHGLVDQVLPSLLFALILVVLLYALRERRSGLPKLWFFFPFFLRTWLFLLFGSPSSWLFLAISFTIVGSSMKGEIEESKDQSWHCYCWWWIQGYYKDGFFGCGMTWWLKWFRHWRSSWSKETVVLSCLRCEEIEFASGRRRICVWWTK